ncbi:MAG: hypothetical protein V3V46_05375 [Anaerolineales bacterium]|jgi:hypothetical protein
MRGEYPFEPKGIEPMLKDDYLGFGAVPFAPMGFSDPIAYLGSLMRWCDLESDRADQSPAIS